MTDQMYVAGGCVANPIDAAADTHDAAVGTELAREPNSRNSDIDITDHDPVGHAARELVKALIETRWSLHAATVVIALRRLCEAVTGKKVDAGPASGAFIDRIANDDRP